MPHGIWRAIAYCEQGIARKEREIQIARAFVPKGPGARHRSLPRHPHSPLPTVFETFADHPGIRDRPATVADNLGVWYFPYDRDARAERRIGSPQRTPGSPRNRWQRRPDAWLGRWIGAGPKESALSQTSLFSNCFARGTLIGAERQP